MKSLKYIALIGALSLMAILPASAQNPRPSPAGVASFRGQGGMVTIYYSRPYSKDPTSGAVREVWGKLVPYGQPWRTGANEATTLITQVPLMFGATEIPVGAYNLYTIPTAEGGKLVFSKNIGGWGIAVDTTHDLAQVDMKREPIDKPLDQFVISIDKGTGGGGVIHFKWENAQYCVPFTVKK